MEWIMLQFNKQSSVASWIGHMHFNVVNDSASTYNLFLAFIHNIHKKMCKKMIFADKHFMCIAHKMAIIYENLQFSGVYTRINFSLL